MSSAIRYAIIGIVLVLVAGSVYVKYEQSRPCATPIYFSIGSIDPQFGTNAAQLRSAAEQAAMIWNTAAGKTLLVYRTDGELPINLHYDARQKNSQRAEALEREKEALEAGRRRLATGNPSRILVEAYNARVRAFNAEVASFNISAAGTFDQGEYVSNGGEARITIFEFTSEDQLTRVLAHEFGHAIGLGHNEDPNSVMFALNESGNLTPTSADLAALKALCNLPESKN